MYDDDRSDDEHEPLAGGSRQVGSGPSSVASNEGDRQDGGGRRKRRSRTARSKYDTPLPGELPEGKRGDWMLVFDTEASRHEQEQLISRLIAAGLEVEVELFHEEYLVHVSASPTRLEEEAERTNMLKRLKKAGHVSRDEAQQFRPFVRWRRDEFARATESDLFTSAERTVLVESIMEAPFEDGGADINPDGAEKETSPLEKKAGLVAGFPMHNPPEVRRLVGTWGSFNPFKSRSITEMRDYAGEYVAYYFAYVAFYSRWLFFPGVVGAIIFAAQIKAGSPDKTPLTVLWSIFVILWATFFLENWRRAEKALAYKWDALNAEETERARPQFQGAEMIVGASGVKVMEFPASKRAWRYLVSGVVVAICCVLCVMVYLAYLHAIVNYSNKLGREGAVLASLVNTVTILVFSMVYRKIAKALTDYENHKFQTSYDDSEMLKRFCFEFTNNYLVLFYIAFFKQGILFDNATCVGNDCMSELQIQLSILFVTKSTVQQLSETLVPWLMRVVLTASKEQTTAAHEERDKAVFEGTYDEFNEMVLQFGFILLFAPAFPLAALVAWINNFIEVRTDAHKILRVLKRPRFRRAEDIGHWFQVLQLVLALAIVTNSAITCFVSNGLANSGWVAGGGADGPSARWRSAAHWTLAIIMEHALFLVRFVVSLLIPDVPERVRLELEVRKAANTEFAATDNKRREQRGNRALLEKRVGDALGTARSLLSAAGGRAGGEV